MTIQISAVNGPLVILDNVKSAKPKELVKLTLPDGTIRNGQVLEVQDNRAILQVIEGTVNAADPTYNDLSNLNIREHTACEFTGEVLKIPVCKDMLGRVFNVAGKPIDGGPEFVAEDFLDVHGLPINPEQRISPTNMIHTGISTIDIMNSMTVGQKISIFSATGLPHNNIVDQICRQAKVVKTSGETILDDQEDNLAIVFATIGLDRETVRNLEANFKEQSLLPNMCMFVTHHFSTTVERIIAPRTYQVLKI